MKTLPVSHQLPKKMHIQLFAFAVGTKSCVNFFRGEQTHLSGMEASTSKALYQKELLSLMEEYRKVNSNLLEMLQETNAKPLK